MARRIFAYGTLELPELIAALLGRVPAARPARLPGYARFLLRGQPYPGIVADAAAETPGLLYEGLEPGEIEILDRFESRLYERRQVRVRDLAREEPVPAEAYVVPDAQRHLLSGEAWDRERFATVHLSEYRTHCAQLRHSMRARIR